MFYTRLNGWLSQPKRSKIPSSPPLRPACTTRPAHATSERRRRRGGRNLRPSAHVSDRFIRRTFRDKVTSRS
eukprot:2748517-Pyramimonas_sp.AAC.1